MLRNPKACRGLPRRPARTGRSTLERRSSGPLRPAGFRLEAAYRLDYVGAEGRHVGVVADPAELPKEREQRPRGSYQRVGAGRKSQVGRSGRRGFGRGRGFHRRRRRNNRRCPATPPAAWPRYDDRSAGVGGWENGSSSCGTPAIASSPRGSLPSWFQLRRFRLWGITPAAAEQPARDERRA